VRTILLLLTSLIVVTGIFVAGMAFTAYMIAEPEPHRFAHLDTPDLWTSEPMAVDPAKQNYERIGAIPAIASLPASGPEGREIAAPTSVNTDAGVPSTEANTNSGIDDMSTGAIEPGDQARSPVMDPAHAEWCFGRYRSYRVEDNSYQPFGGGMREQCQSPWTPMEEDMAAMTPDGMEDGRPGDGVPLVSGSNTNLSGRSSADGQSAAAGSAPVGAHEEWCYARYRSYRVDDNSYQPFDGGPRRICSSPYG